MKTIYGKGWSFDNGILSVNNNIDWDDLGKHHDYAVNSEQVIIEEGVTEIASYAFSYSRMTSIKIPSSIIKIGKYAFAWCSRIPSIYLPLTLNSIGDNAFRGCSQLDEMWIPDRVSYIGKYAFCECSKLSIIGLPLSITSLENGTFRDCFNLEYIYIRDNINRIGMYCFANCKKLKYAIIPDKVKKIEIGTYKGCENMSTLIMHQDVTQIDNYAFANCKNLSNINLNNNILLETGFNSFSGCEKLEARGLYYFKKTIRLKDYLQDINMDDVMAAMSRVWPEEGKYKKKYKTFVKELLKKKASKVDWYIRVRQSFPDTEDLSYKYLDTDGISPVGKAYGIEFESRSIWLGMNILPETMDTLDKNEIIAGILYEMTWTGFWI